MARPPITASLVLTVAIIAAGIADPLVEAASNAGLFGAGHFTDHSNADVLPALALGLMLALWYLVARVRDALSGNDGRTHAWLRSARTALGSAPHRLLPLIFAVQLGVLYLMESCEQLAVRGHLLGATVWLGGPMAISLLVHAVTCIVVAVTLFTLLERVCRTTVRAIRRLREIVLRLSHGPMAVLLQWGVEPLGYFSASIPGVLGERAPPFLSA